MTMPARAAAARAAAARRRPCSCRPPPPAPPGASRAAAARHRPCSCCPPPHAPLLPACAAAARLRRCRPPRGRCRTGRCAHPVAGAKGSERRLEPTPRHTCQRAHPPEAQRELVEWRSSTLLVHVDAEDKEVVHTRSRGRRVRCAGSSPHTSSSAIVRRIDPQHALHQVGVLLHARQNEHQRRCLWLMVKVEGDRQCLA